MTPTQVARAGELRGISATARHPTDVWKLVLSDGPARHVGDELDRLLSAIAAVRDRLRGFIESTGADAQVLFGVRVVDDQLPSISFSADQIRQLAESGLALDVDVIV